MGARGSRVLSMFALTVMAAAAAVLVDGLRSERGLGPQTDVAHASTLSKEWFIPGAENGPTTTTTVRIHNPQPALLTVRQRLYVANPSPGFGIPTCDVQIAPLDTVDSCLTAADWGTHQTGTIRVGLTSTAVLAVEAYLTKRVGTHGSKVQVIERPLQAVGTQ